MVLQENRLLDMPVDPPGWLHYESDTMPGSSGAPLFNNRWEMVGLHHSGWPKRDEQGRILTVNNELWSREMGELAIKWLGNEGARVSQILQIVKAEQAAMDAGRQALSKNCLIRPGRDQWLFRQGINTPIVVIWVCIGVCIFVPERKTEVVSQSAGSQA